MSPEAREASTLIAPGVWEVDPVHSRAGFEVHDMESLVAAVSGQFLDFEGRLEGGSEPRAVGVIRTASVDTANEERDQDLRSSDFFDVDNYPEIRFESTEIRALGDSRFAVAGALEIQGAVHEVNLEGRILGHGPDRKDEERVALEARGDLVWADNQVKLIVTVSAKKVD
jgi:polyisoprenoid-binding protein YceI